MTPEPVLQALTGELYRYRFAIQDQIVRIKAETEQVREERERIEKDEYELLFAPSMSHEAFVAQAQAIHLRDVPLLWRLKSDGEFPAGGGLRGRLHGEGDPALLRRRGPGVC